MTFEVQGHGSNDEETLRRRLAGGATSLELDVGLRGRQLVVAHDTDLADASGLTLERALELAGELPLVVEAKCYPPATPPPDAFAEALAPFLERIAVISFEPRVLDEVLRLRPATPTGLLFEEPWRGETPARTLGPRHNLVTAELVGGAHAAGLRVVPWTVNEAAEVERLVELGVDGVVTDDPELVHRVLS